MPILDQFGRPYDAPPRALNVPRAVGISQPAQQWASVASSLTPVGAAQILRAARRGDADAYLTLAEEIEERDMQFSAVLQTRKLAVVGGDPLVESGINPNARKRRRPGRAQVEPGADTQRADDIADQFREEVAETDEFCQLLFDLMDALNKGYSVVQPIWETSENDWGYSGFEWVDPRLFTFDPETLRELRLKDPERPEGRRFAPGQFVMHKPRIKTGVTIRGGLAMLATIAHVAKSFTLADWLAFCEVYGMPLRVATYDPETMTQPEINALKIALANIGHDAAAIVPVGAKIEILDARRPNANGKNVFEGLANYFDAQLSKAVLGQTMTTDDGASKSQAEVHDGVLLKYIRADHKALMATVRKGFVEPWVRFNHGEDAPVPKVSLPIDPPEDLKLFTEAALPWVRDAGLKVRAHELYEKFGLTPPDDVPDNETIGGPPEPDPNAPGAPGQQPGGGGRRQPNEQRPNERGAA